MKVKKKQPETLFFYKTILERKTKETRNASLQADIAVCSFGHDSYEKWALRMLSWALDRSFISRASSSLFLEFYSKFFSIGPFSNFSKRTPAVPTRFHLFIKFLATPKAFGTILKNKFLIPRPGRF